ncbi:MAG: sulfatase, partial [Deltaproteobacteria bacterium]|nr:sulfatase [Deltaproteobacteria bacterium]
SRWFYIVSAALMIAAFLVSQVRFGSDPRPIGSLEEIGQLHERDDLNVLFVLIDTLRADRLGAYGYERNTSPTIDALASSGVRFAKQMSQSSWTKCSMASLWTGSYPIRTGVLRSPDAVADAARMPAEILREAGFNTYAIWRNAWVGPDFGFSQGFDMYHSPKPGRVPRTVHRENPTVGMAGTDRDTILSAQEFLRSNGDERFFLYLHLMDVHQYVYDEESALFGSTYSDIYDNSIRWVDRVLWNLISSLDRMGLREKTLIILAADHGEAFGEHGREGHARDVYGEVVTTPFILSLPFRLEPGIVVQTPTENVDLWPTVLDLLQLPPLQDPDGRSRMPEILAAAGKATNLEATEPRFAHIDQTWGRTKKKPQPMVAVHDGPYRLVFRPESKGRRRSELYDISDDRYESRRIGRDEPEVRTRLTKLAEAYLESTPPEWGVAPEVEIDEAQLQQLRALGYDVQ